MARLPQQLLRVKQTASAQPPAPHTPTPTRRPPTRALHRQVVVEAAVVVILPVLLGVAEHKVKRVGVLGDRDAGLRSAAQRSVRVGA